MPPDETTCDPCHSQRPAQKRRSHSSQPQTRSHAFEPGIPAVRHYTADLVATHHSRIPLTPHSPTQSKKPHVTVRRALPVTHSQDGYETLSPQISAVQQLLQTPSSSSCRVVQFPPPPVPRAARRLAPQSELIQPVIKHQRTSLHPQELEQQPTWQVRQFPLQSFDSYRTVGHCIEHLQAAHFQTTTTVTQPHACR